MVSLCLANAEPSSCPVVPSRHDLNTLPHHTAATTSLYSAVKYSAV